jgi:hypothetical protein
MVQQEPLAEEGKPGTTSLFSTAIITKTLSCLNIKR